MTTPAKDGDVEQTDTGPVMLVVHHSPRKSPVVAPIQQPPSSLYFFFFLYLNKDAISFSLISLSLSLSPVNAQHLVSAASLY